MPKCTPGVLACSLQVFLQVKDLPKHVPTMLSGPAIARTTISLRRSAAVR